MKKKILLLLPMFVFVFFTLNAQNQYELLLKGGTIVPEENIQTFVDHPQINPLEIVNGHYYRLLQFEKIPTIEEQQLIAQSGIQLLEYLPKLTYIAAIPRDLSASTLANLNVRSVMPITGELKTDQNFSEKPYGKWAIHGSKIGVNLKYHKNLRQDQLLSEFEADGITLVEANGINNFIYAHIEEDQLATIANLPYVAYIALQEAPGVPEDVEGRSLHRANTLDTSFPGGRKYTGEGVAVMVRDDGDIGPHIDFQGRLNSDYVDDFGGTHGDGVSGIMSGAGNLNPRNRGMAAGSDLYALEYIDHFLDETLPLHLSDDVLVTNSSYSNGCNAGYTTITATVDQQMNDNPTFLHVFSAGNSNNNDCGYGAGDQWGNITGGHKQGKNVIATANVNADGTLVESSSRGPAHDGRIKPDIAANGRNHVSTDPNNQYSPFGGTSGAAPGIAGITAQLHEAYRDLNGGTTADAAFLKAVLLNSANDYGNIGPDFKFGWGIVNAHRAALTLEEERYFTGTVEQGMTSTHEIEIPAGVLQVKVMTYWRERESSVMTTKSLINNLDTRLVNGTETHLPWVLDSSPDVTLLDLPAAKGVDDLNNVEQIAIDNPTPGIYTLEVDGTELPFGTHDYYVVYEFITAQHTLTFPIGGEAFTPGEVERLHWDAYGNDGMFILVYSVDGGNAWLQIDQVSGDQRMYEWVVPDEFTGKARVMVIRGAVTDMSDADFSITPMPQNLEVEEACPDYIRLAWEAVPNATAYEIYVLGVKYMESVGTSTTLTFDYPTTDPANDHWFAVRALGVDNLKSRRTNAILYNGGLLSCVLAKDLSLDQINAPGQGLAFSCGSSLDENLSVTITNNGIDIQADIMVAYQFDLDPPVIEATGLTLTTGESANYIFTAPLQISDGDVHNITAWTIAAEDGYNPNDTSSVSFEVIFLDGNIEEVDIIEDFSGGTFPPANWTLVNADNGETWEETTGIQSDGSSGAMMTLDNYTYSAANGNSLRDVMYTYAVDLTDAAADAEFSFDVAYTQYEAFGTLYSDGLLVEMSIDCGLTFPIVVLDKFGDELNTVPNQSGLFTPSGPDDWRNELFDLSPYVGSTVMFKFTNISNWGNNIYIDNINIGSPFVLEAPIAEITPSQMEVCLGESITFTNTSAGGAASEFFWSFGNGAFPSNSALEGPHTVNFSQAGTITVALLLSNAAGTATTDIEVTVIDLPEPNFDFTNNLNTVMFTNTSTNGVSYNWDFGDGTTSDLANPEHLYATVGTYTVTLEVTNECGTESITSDILISTTSVNEAELTFNLLVAPNPSNGKFQLVINSEETNTLDWDLYNLQGQSLQRGQLTTQQGTTRQTVDVTNFAAGIYLMKVRNGEGFKTMKVVVF